MTRFHRAPTPERAAREAALKCLSSIVLIKIEAACFEHGIVLEHLVLQYDADGSGVLSHGEFKALLADLPIDLSPEQVRTVLRKLDADQDGVVELRELEAELEVVHRENGQAGSPWRLYVGHCQRPMINLEDFRLEFSRERGRDSRVQGAF